MEERFDMGMKERDKLHAIRNVLEGRMTQAEAATILRRSERQVRRLCARVRGKGERGLVHGLRGQPSNNRLDEELLGQALSALHNPLWEGFGPTFAQEKLDKYHGIDLGKTTIRNLMVRTNLWEVHRLGSRHRAWRERRRCVGMLVQLDGSTHDWFEGRGPVCVLLIYIDDATSRILYGEFVTVEDTPNLMRTTKTYLRRHGRPVAYYVDKDSIYKINRQATVEEELRDEQPMTQFTRAMRELGVEVIAANSPQAKGRVERGFGTHQDRLVKELRLRGISDIPSANRYLWEEYIPEHNDRCEVDPAQAGDAHRPLLPSHDLDAILCLKTQREVQNDFTIRFRNRFFQVKEEQPVRVCRKAQITVQERLDGSIHLVFKGRDLNFSPIPGRPLQKALQRRPQASAPRIRLRSRRHRPVRPQPFGGGLSKAPWNPPASYYLQS
jgi:hypothetical protein